MKYLRLENDAIIDKHDTITKRWKKLAENPNNTFKIITNASQQPLETLVKALMEADEIWFQTTFIHSHELYPLAMIISKLSSKIIRICTSSSRGVLEEIISLLKDKTPDIDHHMVFSISDYWEDTQDRIVDVGQYRIERDLKKQARKNALNGLLPTGNKVIIGKFGYNPGPEWSLLKEGDIVDEIERPKDDPNIFRGIWVRGLTEPVKLLNEAPYREFTFETMKAETLATEFFSMSNREGEEERELLMWRINSMDDTTDINDFSTEICDYLGIERRHNRAIIRDQLTKYRKKFTFFKEKNPLDRYRYDNRKEK
jgi:hypothetical protein